MSRTRAVLALLVLCALGMAAVGATAATTKKSAPTKLTVWVGWSARELSVFKKVAAEYDKAHPNVTVDVVGIDQRRQDRRRDPRRQRAGRRQLVQLLRRRHLLRDRRLDRPLAAAEAAPASSERLPGGDRTTTRSSAARSARCRCSRTTTGSTTTRICSRRPGSPARRRRSRELTADAKKLTKFNSDGSIKVLGFDPFIGFYENTPERWVTAWGANWLDSSNHSILSKQPGWSNWMKWLKSYVNWVGYNKLVKFQAGLGDEFSASNAFEVGKLAMNYDGEWRVAFIQAEHPTLNYGTAPMPAANPKLYGSGYINGTIIGIPKNGKHEAEAWDLVKYLTTNTHALAELSNGLRNVPSTSASLTSKELTPDAHFATFLKIFGNKYSSTSPITAAGVSYTNAVQNFATKWQAGKVSNLGSSLAEARQPAGCDGQAGRRRRSAVI